MKKITLKIGGKNYEFAYSRDFRILKKREDDGTEFYPFSRFAYWNPTGRFGKSFRKADVILMIKQQEEEFDESAPKSPLEKRMDAYIKKHKLKV